MSAANAAAIRRRAAAPQTNIQVGQVQNSYRNTLTPTTPQSPANTLPASQRGLTIQQVIANFDSRIKIIEDKENRQIPPIPESNLSQEIIDEYNSRFEILANEIAEIKNLLLKLQSFTMDVNKSLHDDRIRVLSDLETNVVLEKSVAFDLDENVNELIDNVETTDNSSKITSEIVDNTNNNNNENITIENN
tara:strand:- start:8379 stop:8951 length:573 start_codon:yes stop_codon:yes gene_type:complete